MKIKKRSGEHEEFDRAKLERSMSDAGASSDVVRQVSKRIEVFEGLSTDILRQRVAEELVKENAAISGAYLSARRFAVRISSDVNPGTVGIHAEHTRGLKSDLKAILVSADKGTEVRLRSLSSASPREIHLSKVDADMLGLKGGSRVIVRFPF